MKKNVIIFLFLSFSFISYSQTWSLVGNTSTNPPTDFVGTTDNKDLVFKTNGSERFRVTSAGRFCLGVTSSSSADFAVGGKRIVFGSNEVVGSFTSNAFVLQAYSPESTNISLNSNVSGGNSNSITLFTDATYNNCGFFIGKTGTSNYLPFIIYTGGSEKFRVNPDGGIGIGTNTVPSGFVLAAKGKIICEEVQVKLYANWPDYVFSNNYYLRSLPELEAYINEHKHLPDVPSHEEIEKDGLATGEMIRLQMQK